MKNYINFAKFVCVGISNTIISLLIYYVLKSIGINYMLSMAIGYIISSITGYFLNKLWVFKYDKSKKTPIYKYYILYCSALVLNLLLMKYQVDYLGLSDNIAPIFTIAITTLYNYFFSKKVVFNNKFKISFKKIKEDINNNKIFYLIIGVTLIFVLTMLINNIYNYPAADDYTNYAGMLKYAPDGKITGLLSFITTIVRRAGSIYGSWQGTYFSNVLFCFNPLFISINMYKFTSFVSQLFWIYSIYFLFKSLANKKNLRDYLLIGIVFLLFSILFMYSISQGLYWIISLDLYLIPYSLSLILVGFLIRYLKTNKKVWFNSSIILAILLGGTNYSTGLFVGFVLFMITLYLFIKNDDRKFKFLTLTIVYAIAFAFNVLCPGNNKRVKEKEEFSILQFINISIVNSYKMVKYLLFKTLYVPFMILLMPTIKKLVRETKFKFEKPIILILLCLACFVIFFMPAALAYKSYYQEFRVQNIQLFYFTIMVTVCFINCYGYMYQRKEFKDEISNHYLTFIGIIASFAMISSIGTSNISGFKMLEDVLYLKSKHFNTCMKEMDTTIRNSKAFIVKVKNCEEYPSSIHYHKLINNHWVLKSVEKYYKKKIVVEE